MSCYPVVSKRGVCVTSSSRDRRVMLRRAIAWYVRITVIHAARRRWRARHFEHVASTPLAASISRTSRGGRVPWARPLSGSSVTPPRAKRQRGCARPLRPVRGGARQLPCWVFHERRCTDRWARPSGAEHVLGGGAPVVVSSRVLGGVGRSGMACGCARLTRSASPVSVARACLRESVGGYPLRWICSERESSPLQASSTHTALCRRHGECNTGCPKQLEPDRPVGRGRRLDALERRGDPPVRREPQQGGPRQ